MVASPDLSVFSRLRSMQDYDRIEEEFQLKKAALLQAKTGQDPAAVKLANEIAKARAAGDTQRINDLTQSAKLYDRGVITDQFGNPVAMGGYGDAVGSIAGTKKAYEANAQNASDLYYDPQTAGAEAAARYQQEGAYKPSIERDIAQQKANVELGSAPALEMAKKQATNQAEISNELNENLAYLPQLQQTAVTLSNLGKKATYTKAGQLGDFVRKEAGYSSSDGAVARTEYMNTVNNQVLPLLRQTFGAAFTAVEGERLLATLGDPNLPPDQKDAALRSFIDQKIQTIQSKQRQTGQQVGQYENPLDPMAANQAAADAQAQEVGGYNPNATFVAPKMGESVDEFIYLGGNPNDPKNWKKAK